MFTLLQSLRYLKNKNIVGDYVGMRSMERWKFNLFKKFLEDENISNNKKIKIFAYDTFEEKTEPDKMI